MGLLERPQHLVGELRGRLPAQRALPLDLLVQPLAGQQSEDQEGYALMGMPIVEQGHDVGVLQSFDHLGFTGEPLPFRFVVRMLRVHHLEGDPLLHAEPLGAVDRAAPADPDGRLDAVGVGDDVTRE